MRVIIAGSRTITEYLMVVRAVEESGFNISLVVSGGAHGVDLLGEQYALEHGIPFVGYPADWQRYGRQAGMLRNIAMAENADALIALWDGKSRGTEGMLRVAREHDLKIYLYTLGVDQWALS